MPEDLRAAAAVVRTRFFEDLIGLGFGEDGTDDSGNPRFVGEIQATLADGTTRDEVVLVSVPSDFPYERPVIWTTSGVGGLAWHRNRDNSLCLWAQDGVTAVLPWQTASAFIDRAQHWLTCTLDGREDELPVLDLERYFDICPPTGTVFTYDADLVSFETGQAFRCGAQTIDGTKVYHVGKLINTVPKPGRRRRGKQFTFGIAIDVGEMPHPPASWFDLAYNLPAGIKSDVENAATAHGTILLLVRYERLGVSGETVLRLDTKNGIIDITCAIPPAPAHRSVRTLRGGSRFAALSKLSVAVVGVGAVGSFTADLLVRSGVGRVALYDHDLMRPGNGIRHLAASKRFDFRPKVSAVADFIESHGFVEPGSIMPHRQAIRGISEAEAIFGNHDLVIDATASGATAALLSDLASDDTPVVAPALHRAGGLIRIDVFTSSDTLDRPIIPEIDGPPDLHEAGCSDPVSPTAPDAVVEAAAWTVRISRSLLLGETSPAPTTIVVVEAQPDEPYTSLGLVVL